MLNRIRALKFSVLYKVGSTLSNRLARRHRRRFGLSAGTSRTRFLARVPRHDTLEIGPFDCPAITGAGVRYFDILDTAALLRRSEEHGRPTRDVPRIDYVSPIGDLAVIDRTFDAILSSHVIEHQPDLVAHLQAAARLLNDGGRYFLIVPDKRYCFDHYLPLSTIDQIARAHAERRQVHTREAVLAHLLDVTHNDAVKHWLGRHGRAAPTREERAAAEAAARQADAGEYVDVHAWTFTPASFRTLMTELRQRGEIELDLDEITDTDFMSIEFYAVLEKRAASHREQR